MAFDYKTARSLKFDKYSAKPVQRSEMEHRASSGQASPLAGVLIKNNNIANGREQEQGLQGGFHLGSVGGVDVNATDLLPMDLGANALAKLMIAGKGALGAMPMLAGTFIGKNAKTWNNVMAETAQQLEAKGIHPEQIWKETGTFKGADGKWRQEIDDSVSELRNLPIKQSWSDFSRDIQLPSNSTAKQFKDYKKQIAAKEDEYNALNRTIRPVEDIYSHPNLYSEYPDLLNLSAHHRPEIGLNGSYGNGKIEFGDVSNPEGVRGLFGHELQHAIQQREGFARGGSPDVYEWEQAQKSLPKANAALELHDLAKELGTDLQGAAKYYESQGMANPLLDKDIADFVKYSSYDELKSGINSLKMRANTDPYEQYRALAGEAESRLTQARMKMTMPERLNSFPPSMFDVPMNKQIVRFGDGESLSISDRYKALIDDTKTKLGVQKTEFELAHEAAQLDAYKNHGLPEGNTAMDRARAMGYDTDVYHGTGKDFPEFDISKGGGHSQGAGSREGALGQWTSDSPVVGSEFAHWSGNGDGTANVMPLKAKLGNSWNPESYSDIKDLVDKHTDFQRKDIGVRMMGDKVDSDSARRELLNNGYDSIALRNTLTDSPDGVTKVNQFLTLNPNQLRSRFAAFNMSTPESRNLLAGSAAGAIGLNALLQYQDEYQ